MDCNELIELYGLGDLWDLLRPSYKESRLAHVRGVMETAHSLAVKYGADGRKAVVAAMFHDFFRGRDSAETDGLIERYGLDSRYKGKPNLSHGKIAAEYMREKHGISDEELLDAVRFHTTGRANMTLLEKIVYIADCVEPSRDYEEVGKLRGLVEEDMDGALAAALFGTISYVREKHEELDEDTLRAYEFLLGKPMDFVQG